MIAVGGKSGRDLRFNLLSSGKIINQDGNNLWIDSNSGICSTSTFTPGPSVVLGTFSLNDEGFLELRYLEQYGFHACPDTSNNYILHAFPLSSAVIPRNCSPVNLKAVPRFPNQPDFQSNDSTITNESSNSDIDSDPPSGTEPSLGKLNTTPVSNSFTGQE